ncbi:MAG: MFS transporter, partial [Pseudomonadota bacterium]
MGGQQLAFGVKASFGIGQLAEGLKNAAFGTFLIFYYNQVLGLSGTLAGIAVGVAVIVDAFTDPLAGSVSDHWKSRQGRRHPFMYASMVPLGLAFYFLFHPMVSSEWGLFIWLIVFANATRTAMSLYHVPHIALGAEMTEDFDERSQLVGYRMFFSYVGYLVAFIAGFGYFFASTEEFRNGQLNADAYQPFALLLSVLMVLTIFISAWGTRSVIPHLPKVPDEPRLPVLAVLKRVFVDLFAAMASKSFRWLFSGVLVVF